MPATPDIWAAEHARIRGEQATRVPSNERAIQRTLVRWLRLVLPAGSVVFAIINEAPPKSKDGDARARFFDRRKQVGAVTGFPDIGCCLPGGAVLWFELKRPSGGVVSVAQQGVHVALAMLGHQVIIATSIETARHGLRNAGIALRESRAEPSEPARVRRARAG